MTNRTFERFYKLPSNSCFIFGPRGCGKSTWLKQHLPDALLIDLLEPDVIRTYSAYPERLAEVVHASNKKDIIIDEVQKLPELLSVVHKLIEEHQDRRFILTGSSSRKLKRTGVNLLAGRALLSHMHPFMAAELGDNFNLQEALQFGLVPLVRSNPDPAEVLRAYIGLYLKEEVQSESLVRNIGNFSRFLEIVSFSHASILNISNIARECQVSRSLVENYLAILSDLLLCYQLPVFTKRAKRATIQHPKFYYFDAGVFNSLRPRGPIDRPDEISGLALEGLIMQHLYAWNSYQNSPCSLYYWRTRFGVEVDFIIYGPEQFFAIEVKNSKHVYPQEVNNLIEFCKDYPEATPILLYCGNEKLKIKNVLCLPIDVFLLNLKPEKIKLDLLKS